MKLIECMEKPVFHLPKTCGPTNIVKYLNDQFDKHINLILEISEPHIESEISQQIIGIKNSSNELLQTIESYLEGNLQNANNHFDKAMNFYKTFLLYDNNGGMAKEYLLQRPYYRARIGVDVKFYRKDMFHIPFSKRAMVNTKRFSIPGLPCLYLSNSVYVCWEELGQPSFMNMQVSKFRQENLDLKILNLSQTPINLQIQLKSFWDSRLDTNSIYHRSSITMLATWPLIIACSLLKSFPGAAFHQEYIVPQLLMQWVMRQPDVHGIKYFSTRVKHTSTFDFSKFNNYVFPPKNYSAGEYCPDLSSYFSLTEPVNYALVQLIDPDEDFLKPNKSIAGQDIQMLEIFKGKSMAYNKTSFGKLEAFLSGLEFQYLVNDLKSI